MTLTRVDLQPCFVIHQRRYRETSLLLEVLSEDHGRVGLVARGARQARGRRRSVYHPFSPTLMSWQGRGELATLTNAEAAGAAVRLQGERLVGGLYVNELVYRLSARNDPIPELYEAYAEAVGRLGRDEHLEQVLRRFELRLLDAIGYGLILDREGIGERPVRAGDQYTYEIDVGPVPASHRHEGTRAPLVSGRTLLALASEAWLEPEELGEAKRLMRVLIHHYLGGRPLATREMFRRVSNEARTPPPQVSKSRSGQEPESPS